MRMGCRPDKGLFLQQVLLCAGECKKEKQDEGADSHRTQDACVHVEHALKEGGL